MQTKVTNTNSEMKPVPRPNFRVVGWTHYQGPYEYLPDGMMVPFEVDKHTDEVVARYSFVSQQIKWLMKDVLNVLEASIQDERQLNAMKLLTKDKFSAKLDWIFQQMGTDEGELGESMAEAAPLNI